MYSVKTIKCAEYFMSEDVILNVKPFKLFN